MCRDLVIVISFFACEWGRASPFRGTPLTREKGDHSWDSSFSKRRFRQQAGCGRCCGSAKEVRAGLQLAVAYGYVPNSRVNALDIALDEVCAMSWRLSGR